MKEINIIITTTLVAILVWIGIEAQQVSRETFISESLLETTRGIDGTMDTRYLNSLENPANVQSTTSKRF
jgi:hypothetical protein